MIDVPIGQFIRRKLGFWLLWRSIVVTLVGRHFGSLQQNLYETFDDDAKSDRIQDKAR